ncbi:MAG TPA: heavy metal-binding domain-containing protein [Vicinamibacterales bacterium]|nr:heavy metal-binding domain-containing protein [Vicinamibacterales bacterium]
MPRVLTASAAVLLLLSGLFVSARQAAQDALDTTAFVCPMHPDYTLDVAGTCPRCGMALVKATPFDVRDYALEFRTTPALVRAGQQATWRFGIRHPGTGEPVRSLEVVHERPYHLFVISQDMEHFQHIHPQQQADSSWAIDVTLPKAGYYSVISDFLPSGGASQLISRPLVTAGYTGDLAGDSAALVPDASAVKVAGAITARVSLDPPTFVAGLYGHLIFQLTDTNTGRPITDLQTYLGAFGHTLIMSEDMLDYVHSHSLDILATGDDDAVPQFLIPPGADLETLRGGPDVTFDGLMPKPGRYRAWTQFRRDDVVHTFTTTFSVVAP